MTKINVANTPLEQGVQDIINDSEDVKSFLSDLFEHGCVSGMVSELIYYEDTVAFYEKHQQEILSLVTDYCNETGITPNQLSKQWDDEDIFVMEDTNKNILAWFAFESVARDLAERDGIEI